jgi:hypothetical protein
MGVFFDYNQAGQQPSWTDATNFNFGTGSGNSADTNNYVANMLLGNYLSASQSNGVFFGGFRFHQVEAYGQDSWKVSRKLTLDYGLRWAYLGPTYTVQPFFQNYFDPSRYNPANAVTLNLTPGNSFGSICIPTNPCPEVSNYGNPYNGMVEEGHGIPPGLADHRYDNLGPRFGFAYDVFGNGKTAIRGGGGIFYERIRQNVNSFEGLGNPPLSFTPTVYNGNVNNFGPGVLANGVLFPVTINAFDKKGQVPTTYGYSLGVQHELPWQMGLDVAYVGNLSRHLQYQYNLQALPVGSVLNLNGLPAPNYGIYKGYNTVNFTSYGGNSSYNALQVKVTRRFNRNLTLNANYTWSKAMDLTDADSPGADGGASTGITDPYHLKRDYAVAGFDRTHAFNFNYVYMLPEFRNRGAFMRSVVGGWEISGITRFWSGLPLDVLINGNAGNFVGGNAVGVVRPDLTGAPIYIKYRSGQTWLNPLAFQEPQPGSVGQVGRNAFRGPGINNWDASLFKNFTFSEHIRLQLRFETFNLFNHVQPVSVNTTFSAPNPGEAAIVNNSSGAVNGYHDSRTIQLGGKFYF